MRLVQSRCVSFLLSPRLFCAVRSSLRGRRKVGSDWTDTPLILIAKPASRIVVCGEAQKEPGSKLLGNRPWKDWRSKRDLSSLNQTKYWNCFRGAFFAALLSTISVSLGQSVFPPSPLPPASVSLHVCVCVCVCVCVRGGMGGCVCMCVFVCVC